MVKHKLSDKRELMVCHEYNDGFTIRKLAKKFSVAVGTIYNILKRGNAIRRPSRKYYCQDNFFDEINTERKAYWLGFLEADGYIQKKGNRIGLELGRKDRNQLEKFLVDLQSNYKIHDRKRFNKRTNKFYLLSNISINSKQMKKALLKYKKNGFITISNKLKRHFIRGLFDGDGCIYQYQKNSGTFKMLIRPSLIKDVQKYLIKKCSLNKIKIYEDYDEVWKFQYGGIRQLSRIYQFLYDKINIFMERKKQIFIDIFTDHFISKESSNKNIANEILIDCWKY